MGVRENKVESHLDKEVVGVGGITRKWTSPGRDGVPDRIVILNGGVCFVEVKTIDGKLSAAQVREHERLRGAGASVITVWGEQGVDMFIDELRMYGQQGGSAMHRAVCEGDEYSCACGLRWGTDEDDPHPSTPEEHIAKIKYEVSKNVPE